MHTYLAIANVIKTARSILQIHVWFTDYCLGTISLTDVHSIWHYITFVVIGWRSLELLDVIYWQHITHRNNVNSAIYTLKD